MKLDEENNALIDRFTKFGKDITKAWNKVEDFFERSWAMLKGTLLDEKNIAKSKEQISAITSELDKMTPLLNEIGYRIRETRIGIGVPPVLEVYFQKTKKVDEKEIKRILEKNKDNKAFRLVGNALLSANSVQGKVSRIGNQKFKEVILTLTFPPRVTLMYVA